MRIFFAFTFFLILKTGYSQNVQIARSYYDNGKFEEAELSFKDLYNKNPENYQFILGLAKSYRQLKKYDAAEALLKKSFSKNPNQLIYLVELGVTQKANENPQKAEDSFKEALIRLKEAPKMARSLGSQFKQYNYLFKAIEAYEIAMTFNPNLIYDQEIGNMYSELGDYANMFSYYLNYMFKRPNHINYTKRRLDEFITDDPENETNILFKRTLLKKNQNKPDILYNELLSWLFVQQKQFRKAFLQEKAIYKKTEDGMPQIIKLALITKVAKEYKTAEEILTFVIENTDVKAFKAKANKELMLLKAELSIPKEYDTLNKEYLSLIEAYKDSNSSVELSLDYAHFLGFKQNKKKEATSFLKKLLKVRLNKIEKAKAEILLADILVLDNKFNQALIYYTKAEKIVKGNPLAQEARFKIAKASYYKGDFDWAKTQLNTLKSATTQLIANDAMQLALIIEDNTREDSTFVALKLYAKAELETFQEHPKKAIITYQRIIDNYKNNEIEDDALFNQAKLLLKANKTKNAIANFEKIIELFPLSLLLDDAYFALGNLYNSQGKTDKAKKIFEQIIFNHADSIYYVETRKAYRKLRGDNVIN